MIIMSCACHKVKKLEINDYVVYKNSGVCIITDIRKECLVNNEEREYYVLTSVRDDRSVVHVPVESELAGKIHHVITKDEIEESIAMAKKYNLHWPEELKKRTEYFREIIDSGSYSSILMLLKSLQEKKRELTALKKKLYSGDERNLMAAEKLVSEEFAFVLGIDKKQALEYVYGEFWG